MEFLSLQHKTDKYDTLRVRGSIVISGTKTAETKNIKTQHSLRVQKEKSYQL